MDAIVQAILNLSKLEVQLIKIVQATPESFVLSIDSKVTHTGPVGATMAPMTVDMVGPKGCFGRLDLPEVKTSPRGARVIINDQLIKIVDMEAYMAFVKSIEQDEKLVLRLENGKGTVKALFGLTANINYKKNVDLLGMNGPRTYLVSTEKGPAEGEFKNIMRIVNPSPVEIDMGVTTFAFRNEKGEILAEQTGNVYITRGECKYEATGKVKAKGSVDKVTYFGVDVAKESWLKQTIKYFACPMTMSPDMASLTKA